MKRRKRHKAILDTSSADDAGGSKPRIGIVAVSALLLALASVAQAVRPVPFLPDSLSHHFALEATHAKRPTQSFGLSGLGVTVGAGVLVPSDEQALFYDGRPERPNTIARILYSPAYGQQIWEDVQNSTTPFMGVGSYSEITIAEYPTMDFRLTYQIALGLRYDYSHGWSWALRFGYSTLRATGQWLLERGPQASTLTNRERYIVCDMVGTERRIYIDLGLNKRFALASGFELEIGAGGSMNNIKVQSHDIIVVGQRYSILDIWGGSSVVQHGAGTYEYINQGTIGFGFYGSIALCYAMPNVGSIDLGYQLYRAQSRYRDLPDIDPSSLHHMVFLRMNVNNFSFF